MSRRRLTRAERAHLEERAVRLFRRTWGALSRSDQTTLGGMLRAIRARALETNRARRPLMLLVSKVPVLVVMTVEPAARAGGAS